MQGAWFGDVRAEIIQMLIYCEQRFLELKAQNPVVKLP